MNNTVNKNNLARTYQAMQRWDIGEDIRCTWRCLVDRNYRPVMTGEWVSQETLKNALKDLNAPDYADWCVEQNLQFQQVATDEQALYAALTQHRDQIVKHGGMCAEFGVFQGHSLRRCAELVPECHWYGFDSFEGFENDWQINNNQYALSKEAFSLGGVVPNLDRDNVSLVKGYFSQSLPEFSSGLAPDQYFSFVHIDCDTFAAAECVFNYLGDRFVKGTIIVFDDIVGLIGITDAMKAFYDFVKAKNITFEWLVCGKGPNVFSVLDRGCVITHWLFANKVGMFSAACILK